MRVPERDRAGYRCKHWLCVENTVTQGKRGKSSPGRKGQDGTAKDLAPEAGNRRPRWNLQQSAAQVTKKSCLPSKGRPAPWQQVLPGRRSPTPLRSTGDQPQHHRVSRRSSFSLLGKARKEPPHTHKDPKGGAVGREDPGADVDLFLPSLIPAQLQS